MRMHTKRTHHRLAPGKVGSVRGFSVTHTYRSRRQRRVYAAAKGVRVGASRKANGHPKELLSRRCIEHPSSRTGCCCH